LSRKERRLSRKEGGTYSRKKGRKVIKEGRGEGRKGGLL
jgi:hypothetical protein